MSSLTLLELYDETQSGLLGSTHIAYHQIESTLVIRYQEVSRTIKIALGNDIKVWIDCGRCSVQLISEGFSKEIYLGQDFEKLFPNAISFWGNYFFKLHYSSG